MENRILQQLNEVKDKITLACQRVKREPKEVKLLLATKTVIPENIKVALEAGETLIGENKIQELKSKFNAFGDHRPEIHFIGHLQSNKIKEAVKYADCIESIDRFDLAQKLDNRLRSEGKTMPVFIQVNTSFEASKFGVAPEEALSLIKAVAPLEALEIKGLMTIGLLSNVTEKVREGFRLLRELRDEANALQLPGVQLSELSMGMSNDMEMAIEEGATIVRVGTAIFGQRKYPDSYYWNENKK